MQNVYYAKQKISRMWRASNQADAIHIIYLKELEDFMWSIYVEKDALNKQSTRHFWNPIQMQSQSSWTGREGSED